MSAPETAGRRQTVVYWQRTGTAPNGRAVLADPVEIAVRIVSGSSESLTANSSEVGTQAVVVVDFRPPIGSSMWAGTLADWLATGSGDPTSVVWEVSSFDEIPDVRCRNFYRKVGLIRKGSRP